MQVIQVKEDMVMVLMDGKSLPPFPFRSSAQDVVLKAFLPLPFRLSKASDPRGGTSSWAPHP